MIPSFGQRPRSMRRASISIDQEIADQYGMTVEAWRARDHEAEWHAFKERDRARRAEIVHWRQGVMHRSGVPVTD